MDRLLNRVEPFAALFWFVHTVLANTRPCPPAWHHSTAVHKECPYMVIGGSILKKMRCPFSFTYQGLLFIYAFTRTMEIM